MTGAPEKDDAAARTAAGGIAIVRALLGTALEARAPAVLAKLLQRHAGNAKVHLLQADLERRAGRLTQAMQAAQRALECDPQEAQARQLAAALRGAGAPAQGLVAVPAPFRLYHDFLAPHDHARLLELALAAQPLLAPSRIGGIALKPDWRQSRVDESPQALAALAREPVLAAARRAVRDFALPDFDFETVEMQFTAHNDGDFYRAHRDYAEGDQAYRRLTFVYYFHRQPKRFGGGELALYDTHHDGAGFDAQAFSLVEPQDNMLIVFPARFWHEVRPVSCPGGAYADSRFTLNGWIGVARAPATAGAATGND